jgi:hypothetical protein
METSNEKTWVEMTYEKWAWVETSTEKTWLESSTEK